MSSPLDSDAVYEDICNQWLMLNSLVPSTTSNEVAIEPNAAPDRSLGAVPAEPLAERPPATVSGGTHPNPPERTNSNVPFYVDDVPGLNTPPIVDGRSGAAPPTNAELQDFRARLIAHGHLPTSLADAGQEVDLTAPYHSTTHHPSRVPHPPPPPSQPPLRIQSDSQEHLSGIPSINLNQYSTDWSSLSLRAPFDNVDPCGYLDFQIGRFDPTLADLASSPNALHHMMYDPNDEHKEPFSAAAINLSAPQAPMPSWLHSLLVSDPDSLVTPVSASSGFTFSPQASFRTDSAYSPLAFDQPLFGLSPEWGAASSCTPGSASTASPMSTVPRPRRDHYPGEFVMKLAFHDGQTASGGNPATRSRPAPKKKIRPGAQECPYCGMVQKRRDLMKKHWETKKCRRARGLL